MAFWWTPSSNATGVRSIALFKYGIMPTAKLDACHSLHVPYGLRDGSLDAGLAFGCLKQEGAWWAFLNSVQVGSVYMHGILKLSLAAQQQLNCQVTHPEA